MLDVDDIFTTISSVSMKFDIANVFRSVCAYAKQRKSHHLAVVLLSTQAVNILLKKSNHVNELWYSDVKERSRDDTIHQRRLSIEQFYEWNVRFCASRSTIVIVIKISLPSSTTTANPIIIIIITIMVLLSRHPRYHCCYHRHHAFTRWRLHNVDCGAFLIQRKNSPIAHSQTKLNEIHTHTSTLAAYATLKSQHIAYVVEQTNRTYQTSANGAVQKIDRIVLLIVSFSNGLMYNGMHTYIGYARQTPSKSENEWKFIDSHFLISALATSIFDGNVKV